MAEQQAFITLKDHKENFQNKPTCRLINPAKSEIGRISNKILTKINTTIRTKTSLNQWKNSLSVIDWFSNIPDKHKHKFIIFDIENFYPSINENLLENAIAFAKIYCDITERDINIIMHARKSLLFNNNEPWIKKGNNTFDVTMGSFDGAEICELVGLYILHGLCAKYGKDTIGLYRDDGLAIFKNISGPAAERIKKDITRHFRNHGLNITIQTNMKVVNYLDVTFNLNSGTYYPYRKPNDQPLYINTKSNHPPSIIKQLPKNISHLISSLSCNETEFSKIKPTYEDALKSCGFNQPLTYSSHDPAASRRKNRQRNIIWYNPPYNKNIRTNIGYIFRKLINKHFPKTHRFHSIFNKNNLKISYSCTENMASIISKHNKKILNTKPPITTSTSCNCRIKDDCPLNNNCLTTNIVYNAKVTTNEDATGKNYIGATEGTFKQRFTQHKLSFKNNKYSNSTELSKYIWQLKDNNTEYQIQWSIITAAQPYSNISRRCDLCASEKLHIIKSNSNNTLNKRSELISKCRHENKYYLINNNT